jgi:DNA-directed RNA polymerase specialized sigma24 family protein
MDLDRIFKIAKGIAFTYIADEDKANEMAQLTTIQYHLNEINIPEDKTFNWVFKVTKNYCIQHFRDCKKEHNLCIKVEHNTIPQHIENSEDSNNNFCSEKDFDFSKYDFISDKDKELLTKNMINKMSIATLSRNYKIKKKTLQNKISVLKNEIRLYHTIQSNPYIFDPLPGTKLYRNIKNFLTKVVVSLKNNETEKLKHYLKDCKFNDGIELLNIKEVKSFRVDIIKPSRYRLLVGFKNFDNQIRFCFFIFTLTKDYSIKILEFPVFPKQVIAINTEYAEGKKGLKQLSDSSGAYNERLGKPNVILKKKIGNIIQTSKDFSVNR